MSTPKNKKPYAEPEFQDLNTFVRHFVSRTGTTLEQYILNEDSIKKQLEARGVDTKGRSRAWLEDRIHAPRLATDDSLEDEEKSIKEKQNNQISLQDEFDARNKNLKEKTSDHFAIYVPKFWKKADDFEYFEKNIQYGYMEDIRQNNDYHIKYEFQSQDKEAVKADAKKLCAYIFEKNVKKIDLFFYSDNLSKEDFDEKMKWFVESIYQMDGLSKIEKENRIKILSDCEINIFKNVDWRGNYRTWGKYELNELKEIDELQKTIRSVRENGLQIQTISPHDNQNKKNDGQKERDAQESSVSQYITASRQKWSKKKFKKIEPTMEHAVSMALGAQQSVNQMQQQNVQVEQGLEQSSEKTINREQDTALSRVNSQAVIYDRKTVEADYGPEVAKIIWGSDQDETSCQHITKSAFDEIRLAGFRNWSPDMGAYSQRFGFETQIASIDGQDVPCWAYTHNLEKRQAVLETQANPKDERSCWRPFIKPERPFLPVANAETMTLWEQVKNEESQQTLKAFAHITSQSVVSLGHGRRQGKNWFRTDGQYDDLLNYTEQQKEGTNGWKAAQEKCKREIVPEEILAIWFPENNPLSKDFKDFLDGLTKDQKNALSYNMLYLQHSIGESQFDTFKNNFLLILSSKDWRQDETVKSLLQKVLIPPLYNQAPIEHRRISSGVWETSVGCVLYSVDYLYNLMDPTFFVELQKVCDGSPEEQRAFVALWGAEQNARPNTTDFMGRLANPKHMDFTQMASSFRIFLEEFEKVTGQSWRESKLELQVIKGDVSLAGSLDNLLFIFRNQSKQVRQKQIELYSKYGQIDYSRNGDIRFIRDCHFVLVNPNIKNKLSNPSKKNFGLFKKNLKEIYKKNLKEAVRDIANGNWQAVENLKTILFCLHGKSQKLALQMDQDLMFQIFEKISIIQDFAKEHPEASQRIKEILDKSLSVFDPEKENNDLEKLNLDLLDQEIEAIRNTNSPEVISFEQDYKTFQDVFEKALMQKNLEMPESTSLRVVFEKMMPVSSVELEKIKAIIQEKINTQKDLQIFMDGLYEKGNEILNKKEMKTIQFKEKHDQSDEEKPQISDHYHLEKAPIGMMIRREIFPDWMSHDEKSTAGLVGDMAIFHVFMDLQESARNKAIGFLKSKKETIDENEITCQQINKMIDEKYKSEENISEFIIRLPEIVDGHIEKRKKNENPSGYELMQIKGIIWAGGFQEILKSAADEMVKNWNANYMIFYDLAQRIHDVPEDARKKLDAFMKSNQFFDQKITEEKMDQILTDQGFKFYRKNGKTVASDFLIFRPSRSAILNADENKKIKPATIDYIGNADFKEESNSNFMLWTREALFEDLFDKAKKDPRDELARIREEKYDVLHQTLLHLQSANPARFPEFCVLMKDFIESSYHLKNKNGIYLDECLIAMCQLFEKVAKENLTPKDVKEFVIRLGEAFKATQDVEKISDTFITFCENFSKQSNTNIADVIVAALPYRILIESDHEEVKKKREEIFQTIFKLREDVAFNTFFKTMDVALLAKKEAVSSKNLTAIFESLSRYPSGLIVKQAEMFATLIHAGVPEDPVIAQILKEINDPNPQNAQATESFASMFQFVLKTVKASDDEIRRTMTQEWATYFYEEKDGEARRKDAARLIPGQDLQFYLENNPFPPNNGVSLSKAVSDFLNQNQDMARIRAKRMKAFLDTDYENTVRIFDGFKALSGLGEDELSTLKQKIFSEYRIIKNMAIKPVLIPPGEGEAKALVDWSDEAVRHRIQEMRSRARQGQPLSHYEQLQYLALLQQAMARTGDGRVPHMAQMIDTLLYMRYPRLMNQIQTGEGKSLINALSAAMDDVLGYRPDVMTTYGALAQQNLKENKPFYDFIGLKVGFITSQSSKKAYWLYDVVYTTVSDGSLREQREKLTEAEEEKIEGEGRARSGIVDEADAPLLDPHVRYRFAQEVDQNNDICFYRWINQFVEEKGPEIKGMSAAERMAALLTFLEKRVRTENEIWDNYPAIRFESLLKEDLSLIQAQEGEDSEPIGTLARWLQSAEQAKELREKNNENKEKGAGELFRINRFAKSKKTGQDISAVEIFIESRPDPNLKWSHGVQQFLELGLSEGRYEIVDAHAAEEPGKIRLNQISNQHGIEYRVFGPSGQVKLGLVTWNDLKPLNARTFDKNNPEHAAIFLAHVAKAGDTSFANPPFEMASESLTLSSDGAEAYLTRNFQRIKGTTGTLGDEYEMERYKDLGFTCFDIPPQRERAVEEYYAIRESVFEQLNVGWEQYENRHINCERAPGLFFFESGITEEIKDEVLDRCQGLGSHPRVVVFDGEKGRLFEWTKNEEGGYWGYQQTREMDEAETIKAASQENTLSLLSYAMGRGTNFAALYRFVNAVNGTAERHRYGATAVIFSNSPPKDIRGLRQLFGRVGRQGQKGQVTVSVNTGSWPSSQKAAVQDLLNQEPTKGNYLQDVGGLQTFKDTRQENTKQNRRQFRWQKFEYRIQQHYRDNYFYAVTKRPEVRGEGKEQITRAWANLFEAMEREWKAVLQDMDPHIDPNPEQEEETFAKFNKKLMESPEYKSYQKLLENQVPELKMEINWKNFLMDEEKSVAFEQKEEEKRDNEKALDGNEDIKKYANLVSRLKLNLGIPEHVQEHLSENQWEEAIIKNIGEAVTKCIHKNDKQGLKFLIEQIQQMENENETKKFRESFMKDLHQEFKRIVEPYQNLQKKKNKADLAERTDPDGAFIELKTIFLKKIRSYQGQFFLANDRKEVAHELYKQVMRATNETQLMDAIVKARQFSLKKDVEHYKAGEQNIFKLGRNRKGSRFHALLDKLTSQLPQKMQQDIRASEVLAIYCNGVNESIEELNRFLYQRQPIERMPEKETDIKKIIDKIDNVLNQIEEHSKRSDLALQQRRMLKLIKEQVTSAKDALASLNEPAAPSSERQWKNSNGGNPSPAIRV